MKKHLFILPLLLTFAGFGQNRQIDSLKNVLGVIKSDTSKIRTLNNLCQELFKARNSNGAIQYSNEVIQYANEASILAEKQVRLFNGKPDVLVGLNNQLANAYSNLGAAFAYKGNDPEALKNYFSALKVSEAENDKKGIASSYLNIGGIYLSIENYNQALKNFIAALKIKEAINDKRGTADLYNRIGGVYSRQGNYQEALKKNFDALKIQEAIGDKRGAFQSYVHIAEVYKKIGNYQNALASLDNSLKISREMGDKNYVASSYLQIGEFQRANGNATEALKAFNASLELEKEIDNKWAISYNHDLIGNFYLTEKKYLAAIESFNSGLAIAKEIQDKWLLYQLYDHLSVAYEKIKDYKKAYKYYKQFIVVSDSIEEDNNIQKVENQDLQNSFDKKEQAEKLEKEKEKAIIKIEKKRQQLIIYSVLVVLILTICFTVFIFRALRLTRNQKIIIEEKNKSITDSINYAVRIQQAFLPIKKEINLSLPQNFILFKPKDIVSGDFYFFHKNEQSVFIAAVDCTGHGVPGAFMSMIGYEKLEDAVSQSTDTSVVLKQLNKGIKASLRQSDNYESTRDGMDIALCKVDTQNFIVKYAGANRPVWIIRNGQTNLEEIKATKTAIGGLTEDNQHFDTHEIKLQRGDTFYICTDGYADQFSGQDGKKLMTRKFKEILVSIQNKTMQEQEKYLNDFVENWKAGTEQVDDILVIGVRL